jgi:hypothetical protein
MPAKAGIHDLPPGPEARKQALLFLKKRSKKTSAYCGPRHARANAPKDQKFFASFFQKRSASLANPSTPQTAPYSNTAPHTKV